MKTTAIILLSILCLSLALYALLVSVLLREKNKQLKGRFTSDQVMKTWMVILMNPDWPYYKDVFDEMDGKALDAVKQFLISSVLESKLRTGCFDRECRKVNRIQE